MIDFFLILLTEKNTPTQKKSCVGVFFFNEEKNRKENKGN